MVASAPTRARISDEAMKSLLPLLKGADSVELKLTVPEEAQLSTIRTLGVDPMDAQIRQVFFFDTPDLQLDAAGLVVRARRVQNKRGDTVVKMRPVVPTELPRGLRRSPDFGVEVDAMPGGFVCSGSLKGTTDNELVKEVVAGRHPVRKLFSKEQRALFEEHAPNGITLDSLVYLGPIFVLKVKWVPVELQSMTAEMWLYPDGSRILELSTKTTPNNALQLAAEARAFLTDRGIALSGQQQTKTRKALDYFARRHAAAT